jgi:5-methylcytosine-specific restriction endonuclease McrA
LRAAAWALANRDRKLATDAAYRMKHREEARAYKRVWAAENSQHVVAKVRAWVKANPDKRRVHSENRRARKKAAGGVLSPDLAQRLMKLQRGLCACCKQPLGGDYHLDHILPLYLGGANVDSNMQLLRSRCNAQKSKKHPVDFMQERGFLL